MSKKKRRLNPYVPQCGTRADRNPQSESPQPPGLASSAAPHAGAMEDRQAPPSAAPRTLPRDKRPGETPAIGGAEAAADSAASSLPDSSEAQCRLAGEAAPVSPSPAQPGDKAEPLAMHFTVLWSTDSAPARARVLLDIIAVAQDVAAGNDRGGIRAALEEIGEKIWVMSEWDWSGQAEPVPDLTAKDAKDAKAGQAE